MKTGKPMNRGGVWVREDITPDDRTYFIRARDDHDITPVQLRPSVECHHCKSSTLHTEFVHEDTVQHHRDTQELRAQTQYNIETIVKKR